VDILNGTRNNDKNSTHVHYPFLTYSMQREKASQKCATMLDTLSVGGHLWTTCRWRSIADRKHPREREGQK
jgi:hypothetical protein